MENSLKNLNSGIILKTFTLAILIRSGQMYMLYMSLTHTRYKYHNLGPGQPANNQPDCPIWA